MTRMNGFIKSSIGFSMAFSLNLSVFGSGAFASPGPDNIYGVTGRLETLKCQGAYVTKLSNQSVIDQALEANCGSITEPAAAEICFAKVVKTIAKAAPTAEFIGTAISGQKTFDLTIVDGTKTLFQSVREGFHADGENGSISLMFQRVGISNDQYTITSSQLLRYRRVNSLIVPVKRRIFADLEYFFLDGCSLVWSGIDL